MKSQASKWITTAILLIVGFTASEAQSASYPRSKGPVSDYAGRLSQAQVAELTSLIEDYRRQTSIEIAVVVVNSLQGQSAREYATGIGSYWGVGKAERNNGVVLLWAPTERAYSLRVADGLSNDLTDADAGEITRNFLLPNFRREEYYVGLKEVVQAVMRRLGNESWEERQRLRQQDIHSSRAWLVPALLGAVSFFVVLAVASYRRRKRNLKLQEMAAVPESVAQSLRLAAQNASRVEQLLSDFQKEMPEQDLTKFTKDIAEQPNRIAKIKADLANLNVADVELYNEVLQTKDLAESEANLLANTQWKLDDIRHAKAQSQQMMQQLSKETFQIADVRDSSKREEVDNLLAHSRLMYNQAYQHSSMSVFDWIMINELLNSSHNQVQQAVQASQADPYVPPLPSDSSSTPSVDTSSFGGSGDFGGGGGFSGGSGSDGSY